MGRLRKNKELKKQQNNIQFTTKIQNCIRRFTDKVSQIALSAADDKKIKLKSADSIKAYTYGSSKDKIHKMKKLNVTV